MRLVNGRYVLIILFLTVYITANIVSAETINIKILREITISSEWITLADIAEFEGISEEDLIKLKKIRISRTLLPGYTKSIPRGQIELLMENEGFNLSDFNLDIPGLVDVKTATRWLSEAEIIEEARDYLIDYLGYQRDKLVIEQRFSPPKVALPDKEYRLEFEIAPGSNKSGNISMQTLILVDNVIFKKIYLGFNVKVLREVYIAKRAISVGEKIRQDDFYLDVRGLDNFRGDLILDFNNSIILDGVVNIPINKEGVLTSYHLTIPDIVFPGDQLQAEIIVGNIQVTIMVKARRTGKKGEYITVENINNGHRFQAQIINSHLVRLVQ